MAGSQACGRARRSRRGKATHSRSADKAVAPGSDSKSSAGSTGPVAQVLLVDTLRKVKTTMTKGSTARAALALLIAAGHEEAQADRGVDLLGAVTWLSAVGDACAAAAKTIKTAVVLGQPDGGVTASPAATATLRHVERALRQEFRHCEALDRNHAYDTAKAHKDARLPLKAGSVAGQAEGPAAAVDPDHPAGAAGVDSSTVRASAETLQLHDSNSGGSGQADSAVEALVCDSAEASPSASETASPVKRVPAEGDPGLVALGDRLACAVEVEMVTEAAEERSDSGCGEKTAPVSTATSLNVDDEIFGPCVARFLSPEVGDGDAVAAADNDSAADEGCTATAAPDAEAAREECGVVLGTFPPPRPPRQDGPGVKGMKQGQKKKGKRAKRTVIMQLGWMR